MDLNVFPQKGKLQGNWEQLQELIDKVILDSDRAQALHNLMLSLKDDRKEGFTHYLGFYRAPAAKGNHHAFEGGLVFHLLEMWSIWQDGLRGRILPHALEKNVEGYVSDWRVLEAILFHDLHKAFCTYVLQSTEPWQVDYGRHPSDEMLGSDVKTLWLLADHGVVLDLEQMNTLLWAEGGFAKIKPRHCSVLAKLCYTLDELSGNVMGRIESRTMIDHRSAVP